MMIKKSSLLSQIHISYNLPTVNTPAIHFLISIAPPYLISSPKHYLPSDPNTKKRDSKKMTSKALYANNFGLLMCTIC